MLWFTNFFEKRNLLFPLFLLSFLYLSIGFNQGLNIYDEGIIVYGASRILQGDVPYKDFWTLYAPGQFYVVSALFWIFGKELLVERIFSIVLLFLLSSVIFLNVSKLVPHKFALASLAFFVIWLGDYRFFANPMPTALLLCCIGSFCLIKFFVDKQHSFWLIFGGIATGIATLFRHEIGLVTFLVELVVIAFFTYSKSKTIENRILVKLLKSISGVIPYAFGFAFVLFPCIVYFTSIVSLDELSYDLFYFPAKIFPKVRSLPFPLPIPNIISVFTGNLSLLQFVKSALLRVHFYFPVVVYIFSVLLIVKLVRKNQIEVQENSLWGIVLFTALGVVYFSQAFVRADHSHLLPTFVPASVLFGILLFEIKQIPKFSHLMSLLAFLLALTIVVKPLTTKMQLLSDALARSSLFQFQIPNARGIKWNDQGAIYQQALEYVQNSVPEGRRIFVGNTMHDKIYINDIMFYFLTNRHSATKYYELHPGLATTSEIQSKIVQDIEDAEVELVVLRNEKIREPNASSTSSGVYLLDDFIQAKYVPVKQFGDYVVLKKKP